MTETDLESEIKANAHIFHSIYLVTLQASHYGKVYTRARNRVAKDVSDLS